MCWRAAVHPQHQHRLRHIGLAASTFIGVSGRSTGNFAETTFANWASTHTGHRLNDRRRLNTLAVCISCSSVTWGARGVKRVANQFAFALHDQQNSRAQSHSVVVLCVVDIVCTTAQRTTNIFARCVLPRDFVCLISKYVSIVRNSKLNLIQHNKLWSYGKL